MRKHILYEERSVSRTTKAKRFVSLMLILCMTLILAIPVGASAHTSDLLLEINGEIIDVGQLAEEYHVDPYELREAIIEGYYSDKASPFSNLEVIKDENLLLSESRDKIILGKENINGPITEMTIVSKTNQDSTAYVSKEGALTASGKTPEIGMCAMHINVTTKTGNTNGSPIKLGTTIYMDNPVNVNGTNYTSFVVEDRGAPEGRTKYWIDIYFGLTGSHYTDAINYGVQTVSYRYYY